MKRQLKRFFLASSALAFVGCQAPPPKGLACVAFVSGNTCTNLCFDMEKDIDSDGSVKPDAKAQRMSCSLVDFHQRINFDPDSFANLKAFVLKYKAQCEEKK